MSQFFISVELYLAQARSKELSITKSVNIWLARDTLKSIRVKKPWANDERKQSVTFEDEDLREIQYEAARQGRSMSELVQEAWILSRDAIKKLRL